MLFRSAAELAFYHPVTGAPIAIAEPLPDDLAAVLAGLRDRAGREPASGA